MGMLSLGAITVSPDILFCSKETKVLISDSFAEGRECRCYGGTGFFEESQSNEKERRQKLSSHLRLIKYCTL